MALLTGAGSETRKTDGDQLLISLKSRERRYKIKLHAHALLF